MAESEFRTRERTAERTAVKTETKTKEASGVCPHCGAPIEEHFEICPVCGWKLVDYCTFCGAPMRPDDVDCPECGMPSDGVICPNCNTRNFRSFCRKCNHPLDHMAQQAIAEAKTDPKFKRMCELQQRMVELERQILESAALAEEEGVEEVELSAEDQALVSEYEELLAMIQNGVAETPQPEEKKDTPKPETPQPEAPKRPKWNIKIEQMREIVQEYKQNVVEMNGIMEDMAPDAGTTPQMQNFTSGELFT